MAAASVTTKSTLSFTPKAKSRNEGGAYFQDEILLSEHFRWVAGARIDKFNFLKGAVVSPRTTFMVKPAPGQTFRVSYNRAYVAPSVYYNYIQLDILYQLDLGLIVPQLAGNYFGFPMRLSGSRDLKEQSLNAYEVGYTATVARGRASLGAAFYINDSKQRFLAGYRRFLHLAEPAAGLAAAAFRAGCADCRQCLRAGHGFAVALQHL